MFTFVDIGADWKSILMIGEDHFVQWVDEDVRLFYVHLYDDVLII